jgi:hypothetical protein
MHSLIHLLRLRRLPSAFIFAAKLVGLGVFLLDLLQYGKMLRSQVFLTCPAI